MTDHAYTIAFHDPDGDSTIHLDRIQPTDLAARPRRSLRIAEALCEEALTNVRDALNLRQREHHG